MPIQIIQRRRPRQDEPLAQAITQGTQGFIQGRQMRQKQDENAIGLAYQMAQMEKLRGETELNQYKLDRMAGMQSGGTQEGLIPNKWDEYGQPSSYYDPRQESLQKQIEEYYKPMSGETAPRFAMAEQGAQNVKNIRQTLGLDDSGNVKNEGDFFRKQLRGNLAINKPWTMATGIAPAAMGVAGNILAGKEGRQLATDYGNLVQNLLRLRTGAAAPIQEQIDEFVRTGYRFGDDPQTTSKKLAQGYQLFDTVKKNLKPNPRFRSAEEARKYGFDYSQDGQNSKYEVLQVE